ncbi:hypothetical protein MAR_002253 [Mya arenaria]|uniref:Cytochrome P450 n=1 Tax=Mya arenaria TaxID=6604 RepID=A0ABY7FEA5_MYAAR|nr:hypothetical protein MAR_002253 [Mya arenaria]
MTFVTGLVHRLALSTFNGTRDRLMLQEKQDLERIVKALTFEFEARIGNNFASDIALDDISITPGRCL